MYLPDDKKQTILFQKHTSQLLLGMATVCTMNSKSAAKIQGYKLITCNSACFPTLRNHEQEEKKYQAKMMFTEEPALVGKCLNLQ